jgi:hypothetical protein
VSRVVVAWTAGTETIKAAVTGKRIRILGGLVFGGASGGTVQFTYSTGDTALTGVMTIGNDGKLFDRVEPAGYCEGAAGEPLRAIVTGAFNGVLLIQEID